MPVPARAPVPHVRVVPVPRQLADMDYPDSVEAERFLVRGRSHQQVPYVQPQLDLDYQSRMRARAAKPSLHLVNSGVLSGVSGQAEVDEFFERQPTSDSDLPDPARWAARLTQAFIEIRSGMRPVHQLARWTSPEVLAAVTAESATPIPRDSSLRMVSSIRVTRPANGVAEVSAVVTGRSTSRAVALRLEGWDGRWLCTTLAMI